MHRSGYIEGKVTYTVISKMKLKLGWKFLINPSFFMSNFFSKCSKKFSIGHIIMFKVCKRCLQPCSLRQKKKLWSYDKYFYIEKVDPPNLPQGGQQLQRNFNLILRDLLKRVLVSTYRVGNNYR